MHACCGVLQDARAVDAVRLTRRLKGEMPLQTLSWSRVGTYLKCPRQYYYNYCLDLWRLPNYYLTLGTAFHKAAQANYWQKATSRQDMAIADVLDVFSTDFDSRDTDFMGEDSGKIKDSGVAIMETYQRQVAPGVQPVEVESSFAMRFVNKSWNFQGKIDLVSEDNVVIETKTTGSKPYKARAEHVLQTVGYTQAYKQISGKEDLTSRIDYAVRKETKRDGITAEIVSYPFTVTDEDVRYWLNLISDVARGIEAEVWPANRCGYLCSKKYCSYWQQCETDLGGTVE